MEIKFVNIKEHKDVRSVPPGTIFRGAFYSKCDRDYMQCGVYMKMGDSVARDSNAGSKRWVAALPGFTVFEAGSANEGLIKHYEELGKLEVK